MRAYIFFIFLTIHTHVTFAGGCMEPFGEFFPKSGKTKLVIFPDQKVKIFETKEDELQVIYQGSFTNFDELKGSIYHNYENAIYVKPDDSEQSHLCFHISDNCTGIKVGVCRRSLELFGGKPPQLDARYYEK